MEPDNQPIPYPFEQLDARLCKIQLLLETLIEKQGVERSDSKDKDENEYMTRYEVAEFLDVCVTTVDHLSNGGTLKKHYFTPRTVRFLRSEVISAIPGNRLLLKRQRTSQSQS